MKYSLLKSEQCTLAWLHRMCMCLHTYTACACACGGMPIPTPHVHVAAWLQLYLHRMCMYYSYGYTCTYTYTACQRRMLLVHLMTTPHAPHAYLNNNTTQGYCHMRCHHVDVVCNIMSATSCLQHMSGATATRYTTWQYTT